jgi:hypothetical protein
MVCTFVATTRFLQKKTWFLFPIRKAKFYSPDFTAFHLQAVGSCMDNKNDCELWALFAAFSYETGSGNT